MTPYDWPTVQATIRGYRFLISRLGIRGTIRYERIRRRRNRAMNRPFIPWLDGEPLARAIGCTEDEIQRLKDAGLA